MRKRTSLKSVLPAFHAMHPWECRHHKSHSEISAYVEASGTRERIATIYPTAGTSAKDLANFFTTIVGEREQNRHLLLDAVHTLEAVAQEGWTYSTEQDVEHLIKNIEGARL